ncbi:MAG: ATP-dependent DNA ligase [Verrucomicrobiota bacterium]|nr:ATP-dependent DNA ligase [Verrucomicrobiota bacterium]
MNSQVKPPFLPMEALLVDEIPEGPQWQYEPKWDGFRCLVFREGDEVQLQSKSGQPLGRYFPELVAAIQALKPKRFVIDGEIVIPVGTGISFDELLMRIHPAASRIRKLAAEHPALLIVFDILDDGSTEDLFEQPLQTRRTVLEAFAQRYFKGEQVRLSPKTMDQDLARNWLDRTNENLDGIIAKRIDLPYASGERSTMQKIKKIRTADCVVGGFRYGSKSKLVGSLLLGLYENGLLHHVGFCSGIKTTDKAALTGKLEKLIEPPGFTGRAPGGPSRWSSERSTEWNPLKPQLVVEVAYDHFTGGRFRHGTKLVRWRPDKAAEQCGMEQVQQHSVQALRVTGGSVTA